MGMYFLDAEQVILKRFISIPENNVYHDFARAADPYLYIPQESFVTLDIIKGNSVLQCPSFDFLSDPVGGFILQTTGINIHYFIKNTPGMEIRLHAASGNLPDLPVPPLKDTGGWRMYIPVCSGTGGSFRTHDGNDFR